MNAIPLAQNTPALHPANRRAGVSGAKKARMLMKVNAGLPAWFGGVGGGAAFPIRRVILRWVSWGEYDPHSRRTNTSPRPRSPSLGVNTIPTRAEQWRFSLHDCSGLGVNTIPTRAEHTRPTALTFNH
jgi:hypothetical protein